MRISGYVKLAVWLSAAEIIFRIKGKFLRMKALQKCTTFSSMNKSLRLRIGQGSGTEFSFGFVDDEMKKIFDKYIAVQIDNGEKLKFFFSLP